MAGSTPAAARPNLDVQARSRALRQELEECLEAEDYARAAQLRDEIRRLQEAASEGAAGEGPHES